MKSVLIGMALLTGGGPESSASLSPQPTPDADSSTQAMLLCLKLAENAFSRVDKATSVLRFEDFIAWARSNREFMLQVERFRLIAEKAVGFEDALSLPDGSDDDSDLDVEDLDKRSRSQAGAVQPSNSRKRSDIPPPWMLEPTTQPPSSRAALTCKETGMPPPVNLQLEWVYGTNGPSARSACRLLATGEAVYFVGSYVVLYSSECHEQRYYRGHRRAIGCLDVNASGEIVATGDACATSSEGGGEIHVWDARSLHCLAVLRNFHPAGVAHVSFPAAASAATTTLRRTQALALGEGIGAGGNSSAALNSNVMKKKPQESEALIASIGSDDGASMALWNWQKEAVVASGGAHPAATGRRARANGAGKRLLALALNEDGDEVVVVGAHFVVFHQVAGHFFKHKKPHWYGTVDPPLQTAPACLSAVYYAIQTAVVGTARGELLMFERHVLTRCVQAHDVQTSVNVCLLSCQSMVLFSAGKDGQIKQWDSTLRPVGQVLDLHALLQVPEVTASTTSRIEPESALEGDDFRICSLAYDAQRRRFLVATRAGNIFQVDDEVPSPGSSFRWHFVASGHRGQPTRSIATASKVGGCFASCGVGERSVKLWSLRRRAFVQHLRFPGACAAPSALEFSNDGERLAVGSEDGTLMLARRAGSASSSLMTIQATMKNTSSAVIAMRFGPLKTEPLLAVTRDNSLIYLYSLASGGRKFSRYMLLNPQARDGAAAATDETIPAHALDFSVDGAFLRTQHGSSTLCFWDLRQRAGTRVTSMATLRNVQWHTHSTSIGWSVGGLPCRSQDGDDGVCVDTSSSPGLTLILNSDGDVDLAPFPCPRPTSARDDSSDGCWLSRGVPQAHLSKRGSTLHASSCQPPTSGRFALRGSAIVTSSQYGPAICQWRVNKELGDVQPRPACIYDQALRRRLQVLGLKDVYFDFGRVDEDEEEGDASHTVAVREPPENSAQRSEAPDLALTFNHRNVSVNQSLACLGNGSYVYGAGPLLIVRHLHSFGAQQRIVASGLQHSVSCLVKHPSEPILAVGSRRDERVVLLRTKKPPTSSTSTGDSFQQVTTLESSLIPVTSTTAKKTLIAVDFCDASDSSSPTVQSDLAAVIWKNDANNVHTLTFYAWKRQLLLTHTPMTRLPVLFGKFTGPSDAGGVHFVSGGVDHVTFWHLNPATGHVAAQQGVFGRHALVQTMLCAVHVAPFVVTGGEDGSVVLWESGVAAHTMTPSSSSRHSSGGDGVVALEHLPESQVVLGALRNGSLVVWKYTVAQSPTRGTRAPGARIQAGTFLQLTRVIAVYDPTKATPTSLSPLFNASASSQAVHSDEAYVQGLRLVDEVATAALVLSNGEVFSVDLEAILNDSGPAN
jgi:WD40 repeat protein